LFFSLPNATFVYMNEKQKSNPHQKTAKSRHRKENVTRIRPSEVKAAQRMVGDQRRDQLAWALHFAQQNPDELTAGELLNDRVSLRAFTRPAMVLEEPMPLAWFPEAEAARQKFAAILLPLEPGQTRYGKIVVTYQVSCTSADSAPVIGFMDESGGALMRFIDLLNELHDDVRRCQDPRCKKWFTGPLNKTFCTSACLSRVTSERLRKGRK
jgi:hypothetical protein